MELSINIEGNNTGDLELALLEIARLIAEGYTSGINPSFSITGEEEPYNEDDE